MAVHFGSEQGKGGMQNEGLGENGEIKNKLQQQQCLDASR